MICVTAYTRGWLAVATSAAAEPGEDGKRVLLHVFDAVADAAGAHLAGQGNTAMPRTRDLRQMY